MNNLFISRIEFPMIDGFSRSYPVNIVSSLGETEFSLHSPITLIYGSNGSGKSTILNIIAHKLNCDRETKIDPKTIYDRNKRKTISLFDEVAQKTIIYTKGAYYNNFDVHPKNQRLITSAEVLNHILKKVEHNSRVSNAMNTRMSVMDTWKWEESDGTLSEGAAYLKKITERNECAKISIHEKDIHSNGEEIFDYFADILENDSVYLLDEPENCLSTVYQKRLADCIYDLAYNYNCQFIIASHSPFFLSIKNAEIINIDANPAEYCYDWRELENMQPYFELFHKDYRGEK